MMPKVMLGLISLVQRLTRASLHGKADQGISTVEEVDVRSAILRREEGSRYQR